MCTNVLPTGVYVLPFACCACEGQKRAPDPLELGLQMAVSYYVG